MLPTLGERYESGALHRSPWWKLFSRDEHTPEPTKPSWGLGTQTGALTAVSWFTNIVGRGHHTPPFSSLSVFFGLACVAQIRPVHVRASTDWPPLPSSCVSLLTVLLTPTATAESARCSCHRKLTSLCYARLDLFFVFVRLIWGVIRSIKCNVYYRYTAVNSLFRC